METHIFNIESRNRDKTHYTSTSQFKYDIAKDGSSKVKNVLEFKLTSVNFPMTFHTINSVYQNNSIDIGGTLYTISSGNYTASQLVLALNTATAGVTDLTSITYDSNTQKTTITTTSALVFTMTNSTSYDSLATILGFTEDSYTINGTQESENVCDISSMNNFFLKINDYGEIENKGKNHIAKITTFPFDTQEFKASKVNLITKNFKFKQPTDLRVLDIDIVDYQNNNINLNGGNISFTIEVISINNSLLKKYLELSFHNSSLKEMILHDNMLEYFKRENVKSKNNSNSNLFNHNNVGNGFLNHMNQNNVNFQQKVSSTNNLKNVNSWQ